MRIVLDLDRMPTPQQRKGITKRNGKPKFYNRQGTDNTELRAKLMQAAPRNGFDEGVPLKLSVIFRSEIKVKRKWWQWKTTAPDLDNWLKNLQDYLTKYGYYHDDKQIVWLEAKKFYNDKNVIEIEITDVTDELT